MTEKDFDCHFCGSKELTPIDDTEELKEWKQKGVHYFNCSNCKKDLMIITNKRIAQAKIEEDFFRGSKLERRKQE